MQEGAEPPARAPYRMSAADNKELKRQLDELLEAGFIRESTSSFAAPVLFVKKKDGSMRMCVDFRALNKVTKKNKAAMPRIDEIFEQLLGAKKFSKLDLMSGYNQLRIDEKDIQKTAFVTKYGHFEWVVLPFGLTDAPATFNALMLQVLKPLIDKCVVVYLDDILIYSPNDKQHEIDVRKVLKLLQDNGLLAILSKGEFFKEKI